MNYIISPWALYGIYVASTLHEICAFLTVVGILAAATALGVNRWQAADVSFYSGIAKYDENYKVKVSSAEAMAKFSGKVFTITCILTGIALLAFILLPDEETMYQMLLASYATQDNVQAVLNAIQSGADYIIGALK